MHPQADRRALATGWQGIGLIAVTYIYFLIFAQFGFLKRLAESSMAGDCLKMVMAIMALGGIGASLLAPRLEGRWLPGLRLRIALTGCATGAFLSLLPMNLSTALTVSMLTGASVGLLTVTLVTHLRLWIGNHRPLLRIGAGVGIAYFVCNFPPLFDASPSMVALCAGALCVLAMGLTGTDPAGGAARSSSATASPVPAFVLVLGCFTALVWLDSAAFFIIQNTPTLKAGTWAGARQLWQNGVVHFFAALGGALLLRRQALSTTLVISFTLLGGACLLLVHPGQMGLASVFYPAGVSIYSVALVAYPSFLARSISDAERAVRAARLYAIAGWTGSALGIGMGQQLRHVPPQFVIGAALLFLAPMGWRLWRERRREVLTIAAMFSAGWLLQEGLVPKPSVDSPHDPLSLAARGRQVYVAEGCIHCHSQYVRPNSPDELMWGAPTDVEAVRSESPPLIGNRRQGPDLANVGNRRSPLWLKAHFMNPSEVSHASIMPSYEHLFRDDRGDALVAYVASLGQTNLVARLKTSSTWQLPAAALSRAEHLPGAALFQQYCATCHTPGGRTLQSWKSRFKRLPPDLTVGPLVYVPAAADPKWRLNQIARIIKFGLPTTDMPGHEYLPDDQIAAIARQVVGLNGGKWKR